MNSRITHTLIELVDSEINRLENSEFTFHSEKPITRTHRNTPTVQDHLSHYVHYNPYIIEEIVSEEEARYNRDVLNPIEFQNRDNVMNRLEELKYIKQYLETVNK